MVKIYYDRDVTINCLNRKKICILGFGNQGHAHALNLKESGVNVIVGLRTESQNWGIAEDYGLKVMSIPDACAQSDIIMILIPDENQTRVYYQFVHNHLTQGKMLLFAHGFSIHYSQIKPPSNIDIAMIAPKAPGYMVRREYVAGRGVPALMAIHQDTSGQALDLALAYAGGIGATRAGVIATTFREEVETDLFGEQAVLCGGITSLMKAGFDTLVEAGYQPELAYFECINEMKLIVDLIYEGGFSRMRNAISNTAEYGDYCTQEKIITNQSKENMKQILYDIQTGKFAREWILENQAGRPFLDRIRALSQNLLLEKVGGDLRAMMSWLNKEKPSAQKVPLREVDYAK